MHRVKLHRRFSLFSHRFSSKKGADEAEAGRASISARVTAGKSDAAKGFGSQLHLQPVASDSSRDLKRRFMKATGMFKSGVTCICKGNATQLGHESESTRQHTCRLSRRRSSSPSTSYSIAVQDRRSSSSSSSKAKDMIAQTEAMEDSNMQPTTNRRGVALDTPCSRCSNDQHFGQLRRFSSEKLLEVTDGYSVDNAFGYKHELLFRGNLDGQCVYVLRREPHEKLHFFSEVCILTSLRHPNIVALKGYCAEDNHLALVFNFVCNRNLAFHLDGKNLIRPMQWARRANLAVQVAEALVYLHSNSIIHGNVNSMYVFLDHKFTPVVAKFDLATNVEDGCEVILQDRSGEKNSRLILFDPQVHTAQIRGSKELIVTYVEIATNLTTAEVKSINNELDDGGYLAPEYKQGGKASMQLDIYAFGVILFELISGRAAYDRRNERNKFLGEWGRDTVEAFQQTDRWNLLTTMADQRLTCSEANKSDMLRMIEVAALCTKKDPNKRPRMAEVLEMLTGNIEPSQASSHLVIHDISRQSWQTRRRPGAPKERVHSLDQDTNARATSGTLPSSDHQTLRNNLRLSSLAAKFLPELRELFWKIADTILTESEMIAMAEGILREEDLVTFVHKWKKTLGIL